MKTVLHGNAEYPTFKGSLTCDITIKRYYYTQAGFIPSGNNHPLMSTRLFTRVRFPEIFGLSFLKLS